MPAILQQNLPTNTMIIALEEGFTKPKIKMDDNIYVTPWH